MKRMRRSGVLAVVVVAAVLAAGSSADATPTIQTVMSGLDAPRGLAWGPEGGLYVAEAGRGGDGPCVAVARGVQCYGATGAITRLWRDEQERVVTGLPSFLNAALADHTGPQDISLHGHGSAYVTIGWGADPNLRAGLGALAPLAGSLLQVEPSGNWRAVADLSAFEAANNPAGGTVDSNPYGLLAEGGGRYVTDAGGNDLLHVDANGDVSLVAVFPNVPAPSPFLQAQAVPTEVERGPDGALYISELTGVPFTAGAAGIYRVVPGQAPQLIAGGFKIGSDGALYVSNNGNLVDSGEVLRIIQ
ncbi:MAG TPA: ScyD/ScyE family protein [Gaiellaceae bacterium]